MNKIFDFYAKHWSKVKNFFKNPGQWFKDYGEALKQLDTVGKIRKILGTVGEWILLYFMLYAGLVVAVAAVILMALGVFTPPKRMTYYETLQAEEREEYEQRTGKPW